MDLTFPARDQALGKVIFACSEATNARPADNFVSNEDSIPRILGQLARRAEKGGVYLGVGPDQNFSMIAHAEPSLAFLVDFRRRNLLLHLLQRALFALSSNRITYLRRLTSRSPPEIAHDPHFEHLVEAFQAAPYLKSSQPSLIKEVATVLKSLEIIQANEWQDLATMQTRLAGPGLNARFLALRMYPTLASLILAKDREGEPRHFLASESLYKRIRELQVNDRVLPVVGDFAGSHTFLALGEWLRARRFEASVIYVSDVEFFLIRQGRFAAYLANLERIPWSKSALLIRTSTREIDHPSRVPGDSSTTVIEPVSSFLRRANRGQIFTVVDLFDPRAID